MSDVINQFMDTFKNSLSPLSFIFLIPLSILIIFFVVDFVQYKNGSYYKITKSPYFSAIHDAGKHGEYLIYKYLKGFEKYSARFLFNIYIPKENGETTEIDVMMICKKGIFVFESKNYSGWIFGNESQFKWYQTLPNGRNKSHKEQFYNPILQNKSHITHLASLIGKQELMRSVIVFSERCTLKNVVIESSDIAVLKRDKLAKTMSDIYKSSEDVLSESDIDKLYNILYPYTQTDDRQKAQHIKNIQNRQHLTPNKTVSDSTEDNNANKKSTEADRICPKCGGKLILRTSKRGTNRGSQFWGCENYPNCKHTEAL